MKWYIEVTPENKKILWSWRTVKSSPPKDEGYLLSEYNGANGYYYPNIEAIPEIFIGVSFEWFKINILKQILDYEIY